MIKGLGVDMTDIGRIAEMLGRDRFLARCFTQGEQAYVAARDKAGAQSAAAMFAAKEAALKALGTGMRGIALAEVETQHDELGAPKLLLHGAARGRADEMGVTCAHLSLSHEGNMAVAVVILEGPDA